MGLGLRVASADASVASAPPSPVGHVRFSPNGAFLLVSTLDGRVRLLDTRTGARRRDVEEDVNAFVLRAAAFARLENETGVSTCVISGSEDGAARAWEIQSRRLVGRAGSGRTRGRGFEPGRERYTRRETRRRRRRRRLCSATQTLATCGLERDKTVTLWRARREDVDS